MEGAAYVALGTLYYMTPGWPISFGDENKAEKLLQQALIINSQSIDSNYFYADYLLTQNKTKEAYLYFERALAAPIRPEQAYADKQLKKEALSALRLTKQRKLESGKNKFFSLFTSAKAD
jgi:Tfp pilus assembly protein PilF